VKLCSILPCVTIDLCYLCFLLLIFLHSPRPMCLWLIIRLGGEASSVPTFRDSF
jgi:hypothetical protein